MQRFQTGCAERNGLVNCGKSLAIAIGRMAIAMVLPPSRDLCMWKISMCLKMALHIALRWMISSHPKKENNVKKFAVDLFVELYSNDEAIFVNSFDLSCPLQMMHPKLVLVWEQFESFHSLLWLRMPAKTMNANWNMHAMKSKKQTHWKLCAECSENQTKSKTQQKMSQQKCGG